MKKTDGQLGKPLVSIVIPCFNHDKYVQDCIKSVIAQEYQNIELIIIDDGSIDQSVIKIRELVPDCMQRFVRFEFRTRKNVGLCATLNEAIEWCSGDYYAVIASDDFLFPQKTEIQVNYLEKNPLILGVFGRIVRIYDDGRELHCGPKAVKCYDFEDVFLHRHFLIAATQMVRLSAIKKIKYRSDILIEDWYMWLELSKSSALVYLPVPMAVQRRHENNISKQIDKISEARRMIINLYSESHLFTLAHRFERICTATEYLGIDNRKSFNLYLSSNLFFTKEGCKYLIKLFLNILGLDRSV